MLSYVAGSMFQAPGKAPVANSAAAPAAVAVETAVVTALAVNEDTNAIGSLKANESVILRPEVSGKVVRIGFRDGALVRRGGLLVGLGAAIPAVELAQAMARGGEGAAREFCELILRAQGSLEAAHAAYL